MVDRLAVPELKAKLAADIAFFLTPGVISEGQTPSDVRFAHCLPFSRGA